MHLFLTGVLPFLAHDHAAAAAFLTCRHHNFHGSIIPEFLSDDERVEHFCEARQQQQRLPRNYATINMQYSNLYNLFVQTPLMQFSPSLVLHDEICFDSILKPLLETKYFTRTLQRCSVGDVVSDVLLTTDLFQSLSKVKSLTNLYLEGREVNNEHLEFIINSFPSLKTLTVHASGLDPNIGITISSPPPPATKTLRNLTMHRVDASFVTQFVPHFPNLRKLALRAKKSYLHLDLLPLLSSLSLLTDLELEDFELKHTESIKNLQHLSALTLRSCRMPDSLSFLTQENALPELATLCIHDCDGLSTASFASLANAPNLRILKIARSNFDNDCLKYLEKMIHLRKLDLTSTNIVGDSRLLKTLMENLFQLEELNLEGCRGIGNDQGGIAGALYISHSRLRVLNLSNCNLVDDDLNGISALRNTLEVLNLSLNYDLTSEGLMHCRDLVKLKTLNLHTCCSITDLSPLEDCLNLEELNVSNCWGLTDDSVKVLSEEPNSFPNLRKLNLSYCKNLKKRSSNIYQK